MLEQIAGEGNQHRRELPRHSEHGQVMRMSHREVAVCVQDELWDVVSCYGPVEWLEGVEVRHSASNLREKI